MRKEITDKKGGRTWTRKIRTRDTKQAERLDGTIKRNKEERLRISGNCADSAIYSRIRVGTERTELGTSVQNKLHQHHSM